MSGKKTQWHPGFVAAMNLEFKDNRDDLQFESEHNLNTKPLEIDLLIIKKNADSHITNEIGSFFRGHNIIECKSPADHLDIDVFYKSLAYACLYKSYGATLDTRKADDITISIIRDSKPRELFRYFKDHSYTLANPHKGIYYIEGNFLFPTQFIITRELDMKMHTWLRSLSDKLEKDDIQELLHRINQLPETADQELADSVLRVCLEANKQTIQTWEGDANMFEYLLDFMQPQLQEMEDKKVEEALTKGRIEGTVDVLRDFGQGDSEIQAAIIKKYNLSAEEAATYL